MRVVHDRVHVGLGADGVLEHFLMDGEVRVAVEVVVGVLDVAHIWLLIGSGGVVFGVGFRLHFIVFDQKESSISRD